MATLMASIKLFDGVSGPLSNICASASNTINTFETLQGNINSSMNPAVIDNASISMDSAASSADKLSVAVDNIGAGVRDADVRQRRFNDSVNNGSAAMGSFSSSVQQSSNTLSNFMQSIGVLTLVNKGINMVTSSIGNAVSRYDTLNNFPKVMQQMGYSANEASTAVNRLSDGIMGLPTALNDITGNVKQFEVITKDLNYATESTLALNNAFLASGASSAVAVNGTEQYLQMLGNGVVDAQSWRSVANSMTYALNEVAEAFGYTSIVVGGDFYTALQDGNISMAQFNNKLIELSNTTGGFAEVAQTATGGIGTAWENLKTAITRGVTTIIDSINGVLENTSFGSIEGVINSLRDKCSSLFEGIANGISTVGNFFVDYGPTIIQLLWGIVGAVAAWKLITIAVTIAQQGLNLALLSNPITWIAIIIGIVVMAIVQWIQSVGSLKVAWLIASDKIMTAWETVKIVFLTVVYAIIAWIAQLNITLETAWVAVQNGVGNMKVAILTMLQDMINKAIDQLNSFIEKINNAFGTSFEAVAHVTFATNAAAVEEAARQAREAGLADYEARHMAIIKDNEAKLQALKDNAAAAQSARQVEIAAARTESTKDTNNDPRTPNIPDYINNVSDNTPGITDNTSALGDNIASTAANTANTASNTESIAKTLGTVSEELKYLREIREQQAIDKTTSITVNIEMANTIGNGSDTDIDGIISSLSERLGEAIAIEMQGVTT